MNLKTIYDFYGNLHSDNLSFMYQGNFNDDIMEKTLKLSEYNIDNIGERSKLKRKVSFLMVECFQNIIKHGDKPGLINRITNRSGIFFIRNLGNTFYVTSANLIKNDQVEFLKSKIKQINKLDKDELKALFMDVMTTTELSSKGGAGLGFIEMARKSGQKMEFDFEKVNDKLSSFYLQIKLQSKDTSDEEREMKFIPLTTSRKFIDRMMSENIFMIFKGDYSQDSIMPVIKMIEDNMELQLEEYSIKKKVYLILVEVLQNISKHSKEKNGSHEGIFMMGTKDQQYIIGAGNFIENEKIESLKSQLNNISALNKTDLNELYKRVLKEGKSNVNGGAGLGLIDIARESSDKLEFDFTTIDKKTSFFSLYTRI
ncbi:MAG: SiaB family protein kinase [Bacteroidota bacterium]